jgi:hypothetical protein
MNFIETPFYIDISDEVEDFLLGSDGIIYDKPIFDDDPPEQINYKYCTKVIKGVEYWTIGDKYINTRHLFARYFLPLTKPPTDSCWNKLKVKKPKHKGQYLLLGLQWDKPTASKAAETKEKYISRSGKYYQFTYRTKDKKVCNRFATLAGAKQARLNLLGF